MSNIINNLQTSDTWKIQLTIAINFIFSKDSEEERIMHSKSNNIKFASFNDANEVVDKLFESLCSLETTMRASGFIFDSLQLIYCKCHEVNFRRNGSYIDSPDWIKKKNVTTNPKNTDDKCFQYAATVASIFVYKQI